MLTHVIIKSKRVLIHLLIFGFGYFERGIFWFVYFRKRCLCGCFVSVSLVFYGDFRVSIIIIHYTRCDLSVLFSDIQIVNILINCDFYFVITMSIKTYWSQFRVKFQWLLDSADLLDRPDLSSRLSVRLLTVNNEFMALENSYQRILEVVDESIPVERDIVTVARADYVRALEAYDRLMAIKLEESPSTSSSTRTTPDRTDLDALLSRLPALRLPSFGGEMDQWVGFSNLFDSLVDRRTDLSPGQKLAYLMSCLSGEPRGLVQHLKITDENYSIARDLLLKRYQNTRRLGDVHLDQIMKLPTVSGKLSGLRSQFLNPLIMAVNQLDRLGFPTANWSLGGIGGATTAVHSHYFELRVINFNYFNHDAK